MFKNYLKAAWRNIARQRLTSFINIVGLAIAMTAVILIATWVQNELSFDNYHDDANRIYLLKNNWQIDKNPVWVEENSFYPLGSAIQNTLPGIETFTRMFRKRDFTITVNNNHFRENAGIEVDPNWFDVFKYSFIYGNARALSATSGSVVVTASKAKQLFGTENALGKQFSIDSALYNVAAVIKDNPLNSSFQFDIIMPASHAALKNDWLYLQCRTFIKLQSNINIAAAEQKINAVIKANSKADGSITVNLLPLRKIHFANDFGYSAFKHGSDKTVVIFSVLAVLLLLTAAINYVNLSMARTGARFREIGIRKINGASRTHLFFQLITESVLTGILALLLTLVLLYACFPLLKMFSGSAFVFNPLNSIAALILFATFAGVVMLTGFYPAVLLSAFKPADIFKSNGGGIKNSGFKKVLVTAQFTLAVFMIIAAVIVNRQMNFVQHQNIAYNRAQVFTAKVPENAFPFTGDFKKMEQKRDATLAALKHELLANVGVKAVSRTDLESPENVDFTTSGGLDWDGKPQNFEPQYVSYSVDTDIDSIMHYTMIEGRWFDKDNMDDKNNVVLNETAVKQFGLRQPVTGKRFNDGVIIGVVKDFYHQSLHKAIAPLVIRTGKALSASFVIQANAGQAQNALKATQVLWKKYFPGEVFEYSFADTDFDELYKNDEKALIFTEIFSGLSILICCMGLLGITIFMGEQRTKEIGIRKVLGASTPCIVVLMSKDFLKLVSIAVIIASPLAWFGMYKWLQNYAYRIEVSVDVFILAAAVTLLLALFTSGWQALKSAMANPVEALRNK
ncbi:MAG TPA: ABC transporter permease [Chitinophagaceae bacterium]|nr:ABC transporter permease [Chitinophagaceae bacterium]